MASKVKLSSTVTVLVVAADVLMLVNRLNNDGICLKRIELIDELSIQFVMSYKDYLHSERIFKNLNCDYRVITKSKLHSKIKDLVYRPVAVFAVLTVIFMTIYLPTRILFVQVNGNITVPTEQILEVASNYGIRFGASRRDVRSERVKNALIEELPQLQWAGVNTDGCVVTIQLSEKSQEPKSQLTKNMVSSIIALRDGVILTCTVMKGTPLCKTGQAVTEGQILVSGYTDCGICVQATTAEAEVLAQTKRELHLVTPDCIVHRIQSQGSERKYSIRIGKKIIKLWKDSGIRDATCVKIHNEKQLVLPGGFALPVFLIVDCVEYWDTDNTLMTDLEWLREYSDSYLRNQMIAGHIIEKNEQLATSIGVVQLTSTYDCTEMIGQTKNEEITLDYGYD